MATYADSFSGRPAYSLRVDITTHEQDIPNNRSRFNVRLYLRHDTSASNGTYVLDNRSWSLHVGSWSTSGSAPFLMGPSGDYVGKEINIYSGITGWIDHEDDGTLTVSVTASHNLSDTIVGIASLSGSYVVTTIQRNRGKVGVDGAWVDCEIYTGINGAWVPTKPYGGQSGAWKEIASS